MSAVLVPRCSLVRLTLLAWYWPLQCGVSFLCASAQESARLLERELLNEVKLAAALRHVLYLGLRHAGRCYFLLARSRTSASNGDRAARGDMVSTERAYLWLQSSSRKDLGTASQSLYRGIRFSAQGSAPTAAPSTSKPASTSAGAPAPTATSVATVTASREIQSGEKDADKCSAFARATLLGLPLAPSSVHLC